MQTLSLQSLVALTPEQDHALLMARDLEEQIAKMEPFAPGKSSLAVAARCLRDYVAATL